MIINETTKSLEEKVYLSLEDAIISGEYKRGDSLTEMSLSKRLGVSRTPIRSALHRLSEEGLIDLLPNRGAVVVGVSTEDLSDAYRIRMRLEGLASAMAAERISEEGLTRLEEIIALSEFYLGKGDVEKLRELDSEFHLIIYNASDNRMLSRILSELHRNIRTYRGRSLSVPGRLLNSIQEHRDILCAIREGDADKADKLTFLHIENAMNNMLTMSKSEEL